MYSKRYSKRLITLFFVGILSACSSINDIPVDKNQVNQDINSRNKQVSQLNSWTIAGKIAFIIVKNAKVLRCIGRKMLQIKLSR